MVKCRWLLIFLLVSLTYSYRLQCPDFSQRTLRALGYCTSSLRSRYTCLYDTNKLSFTEQCNRNPDFVTPGEKYVLTGNLRNIDCSAGLYQPFRLWSNVSGECLNQKSLCEGEGQIIFNNGSLIGDRTCRCDYTKGYKFIKRPNQNCSCNPSIEDCSCYISKCPDGSILMSDYECGGLKHHPDSNCPLIGNKRYTSMTKTKTTPRMSEHWECVFCPSTFSKKDDRDKHLAMCAGARLFCKYDGCFYNTDKGKNLQRHVRNKHVDTKLEGYKSKELVDTSDSTESEEWERQDPGEVIKTNSGTESEESELKGTDKDDNKVTPVSEKNISDDLIKVTVDKENETTRKVVCRNDDPIAVSAVQVGRTIRQKTSPRLPGKRSEAEKRHIQPNSTKGSNDTVDIISSVQERREDSCADQIVSLENNNIVQDIGTQHTTLCPTCSKRKLSVSCGVQTDPIFYTKTLKTETSYREGSKRIKITELKESI